MKYSRWFAVLAAVPLLGAGAVPASAAPPQISARAYLSGQNPQGMAALAKAVSDPAGPAYRHFLSAQQFWHDFGPTPAQTTEVQDELRAAGATVTGATSHYVAFTASPAQVEAWAKAAPDHVIAVVPVAGNGSPAQQANDAETDAPATACSHYYGEVVVKSLPEAYGRTEFPATSCGYLPSQLRKAYGVTHSGLTGKGVKIGVVGIGTDPQFENSLNADATAFGDKAFAPGQFAQRYPTGQSSVCDEPTWGIEREMDATIAHGMAPDADVVYSAANCAADKTDPQATMISLLDGLDRLVDDRAVDVVSTSWTTLDSNVSPAMIAAWDQTFQQSAIEGIGLYYSSGDKGDNSAGGTRAPQTEYPASDPWVTAVGGTTLEVDKNSDYVFETGWGTTETDSSGDGKTWSTSPPGSFNTGTGGGRSALFHQPPYQNGVVPAALSKGDRVVPDVAVDADFYAGLAVPDPLPGGLTNGGTSLASPLFAAIQADAQQAAGTPIGFANPLLYAHHGSALFHDVTDHPFGGTPVARVVSETDEHGNALPGTATLITDGHDGALTATPGYDDVTGLGSPALGYLAAFSTR
ncbi:S53 family serine peptidase [Amycolatopsis sp. NPDC050768]|uniref:S53 family peptidase n=1 Tax=Amycolatopsis sp. NPDC050768 TaxID=3154839 RepID=UPI003411E653